MRKFVWLVLMISTMAMAQNDSMIMVKKSELPAAVVKKYEIEQQLQSLSKYGHIVEWAKGFGIAVESGLSALGNNIDKIADTKAGKFTMFIIAFKVIGYPAMQFTIGLILIFIGIAFYVWFIVFHCMQKYTVVTQTWTDYSLPKSPNDEFVEVTKKEKKPLYNLGDLSGKMGWATLVLIVYLALTMAVIFAH